MEFRWRPAGTEFSFTATANLNQDLRVRHEALYEKLGILREQSTAIFW